MRLQLGGVQSRKWSCVSVSASWMERLSYILTGKSVLRLLEMLQVKSRTLWIWTGCCVLLSKFGSTGSHQSPRFLGQWTPTPLILILLSPNQASLLVRCSLGNSHSQSTRSAMEPPPHPKSLISTSALSQADLTWKNNVQTLPLIIIS